MSINKLSLAAAALSIFAGSVSAEIAIKDAYARVASKAAKAGAAFMVIENTGEEADQLIGVRSDVAHRTELHTHKDLGGGVMKMMHVEEGFTIPAAGSHALARGGDHVMFMGLKAPLAHGDVVPVTLIFENAGEVALEIAVDLERKDAHGGHGHGGHDDHGDHGTHNP